MVKFNFKVLAKLIAEGYTYIVYQGQDKGRHGFLQPLKNPVDEELLLNIGAWQLPINEREFEEMASGVDVINFKFYIVDSIVNKK